MRSIPLVHPTKVRCAPFHLASGADPIGSTGSYDAYLCVEVPLPWGRDISEHEPFSTLGAGASIAGADGRSWRPQGLVPRPGTDGRVRVLAMEQLGTDRPARPYTRRGWSVRPEQVEPLCRALVAVDDDALAGFAADLEPVADEVVDLFLCTHGRRDVCCGGSGTVLHDELAELLADDGSVRLWRVSHTGGHRFAPTALSFPDGYAWAHLDVDTALGVVRRDRPVGELLGHCRGASSVGGAAAQVADREVFARVGWAWTRAARVVRATEPTGDRRRSEVHVDATLPDGARLAAMVQVEIDREVPQPTCGDPQDAAAPMAPVWRVARVDRLPAQ
jgi:hypothetical protein